MSKPLPYPYQTLPQVVEYAARQYGEAQALVDGELRLSFLELLEATDHAARAFMASGLRRGDRVAIWAPNIWEWIIAATGLQAAGGVLVPLNTRFKGPEARYVLRKSGARLLCTVTGFLDTDYVALLRGDAAADGGGASQGLPDLEDIIVLRGSTPEGTSSWQTFLERGHAITQAQLTERRDSLNREDLCDILFTSGTTGNPKGVMTSHAQVLRATAGWIDCVTLRAGDRYLIVNPFFHAFGYRSGWLASLMAGATILPHSVFDVPQVLSRVAAERISVLPGPPTLYQSILAHPDRTRYDLSSLRVGVTGAAAIPVELVRRVFDELDFEVLVTGYALTEASACATMCRPDDDAETIATTSGRAVPDVEICIVDTKTGDPLPTGEPGEVLIRGYNVMRGYFEEPEETAKAVDLDGWLHTGDIGILDERGYLRITDRLKDMLIVGGFNAYPAEIENILVGLEKIQHVAVIGVPDQRMGEVCMAFIVLRPGETATEDEIIRWSREHMANYKVPRHVAFLDQLPLTPSGKVQKFQLRALARTHLPSPKP